MESLNPMQKKNDAMIALQQTLGEIKATGRESTESDDLHRIEAIANDPKTSAEQILELISRLKKGRQEHDWDDH